MKKNYLLAVAIAFMSANLAMAKSLVLTLADNTKVYYLLGGDVNPKMHFLDGKLTVNADEYTFEGIKNFRISNEDDPNGIESILGKNPSATLQDGTLYINKLVSADEVKVYNAAGATVNATIGTTGSMTTIDAANLAKGVYVVKIGKSSVKFIKK